MACKPALSKEKTIELWEKEHNQKITRVKAGLDAYCDPSTITRSYNRWGLPPPKKGRYKKRDK